MSGTEAACGFRPGSETDACKELAPAKSSALFVMRGTCNFVNKTLYAEKAGASAVLVSSLVLLRPLRSKLHRAGNQMQNKNKNLSRKIGSEILVSWTRFGGGGAHEFSDERLEIAGVVNSGAEHSLDEIRC
eukprot:1498572-Rhodomonas_salina.1